MLLNMFATIKLRRYMFRLFGFLVDFRIAQLVQFSYDNPELICFRINRTSTDIFLRIKVPYMVVTK